MFKGFFSKKDKTSNIKIGSKKERQCYICKEHIDSFTKTKGGSESRSSYLTHLNMIGSDRDNFGCPICKCHDRERHLYMFFDKLALWKYFDNNKVLHFAPETHLKKDIKLRQPEIYIQADLMPQNSEIQKIDITSIPYSKNYFDIIICNHVLEHVPDYMKALAEIYRVLNKNGIAILQTPLSRLLKSNFSDENINTDDLRLFFYGQEDHCRIFSEESFYNDIIKTGFKLEISKHSEMFTDELAYKYGVNKKEDLILARKV
ncbi:MAG: methyltransferase domain-containing protein [Sphingobacteriales bacterium]|nr:methyltransferase domain-containing protein [Sphingobacteriales bacterium]